MIKFILNPFLIRPMAIVLIASLMNLSFRNADVDVTLKAGTNIQLETVSAIYSETAQAGQMVDFKVTRDIKVDDVVVIPAGTIAKGQISRAEKAKGLGKEGYVEVRIKSLQAVDGQEIYLTGGDIYQEGEDRQTLAIVLGLVVCILFLTMKGKNAQVPAGYEVNASVATTTQVSVD